MKSTAELRKDVFAWYGGAAYYSQCFEIELSILLLHSTHIKQEEWTKRSLEKVHEKISKMTLGQLIKELKKTFEISPYLEGRLSKYLEKRNYLIHNFFYENSYKLPLINGCNDMIEELQKITKIFQEADSIAMDLNKQVRKRAGISEEKLQASINKMVDEQIKNYKTK